MCEKYEDVEKKLWMETARETFSYSYRSLAYSALRASTAIFTEMGKPPSQTSGVVV